MPNPYSRKREGGHSYVHRFIAEQKLGRRLMPSEVVHHCDGNKQNNHPDNLLVFKDESSHQLLHKLGSTEINLIDCGDGAYIAVRRSRQCQVCGKEFFLPKHAKKTQKFCSKECGFRSLRRVDRPSKEELARLVWSMPMIQLSQQLGVSDKAIAKWCAAYEIPRPPAGYWIKKRSEGN